MLQFLSMKSWIEQAALTVASIISLVVSCGLLAIIVLLLILPFILIRQINDDDDDDDDDHRGENVGGLSQLTHFLL